MSDCRRDAEALRAAADPHGPATLRTDTLADSILLLLVLTGLQRAVGFCRAILFCRWLDPEQLGQWDMAFNFLLLAAPVSVLALTGSFPRYAEHYLQRRQLRAVLKRTAVVCAVMGGLAAACIRLGDRWFSQLIFGTPDRTDLVALLAVGLVGVIAMNYFIDLFSALRNVRLIAGLHMLNSLGFAVVGIALLLAWQCTASSVVVAYAASTALAAVGGTLWLVRHWRAVPGDAEPPPHAELWSKLVPFAAWVWLTSVLANLFVVADRYMLVHYSAGHASEALARVGEYHSSRVLPTLLVSIAMILASMITAHLSHDWESGRRRQAAARLNLVVKLFGLGLLAAGVVILLVAPVLFREFLRDKYAGGLAVLPWTLTYCVWFALFCITGSYLLCREKAHLASVALAVGLVTNVVLNLLLLPRLGLLGAVLATTAANLVTLLIVVACNHFLGAKVDFGVAIVLTVPVLFCLGPWVTLTALMGVAVEAFHTDRVFSRDEKRELAQGAAQYWQRLRSLRATLRRAGGSAPCALGATAQLLPDQE